MKRGINSAVGRLGALSTLFFILVAMYAPFLRSHLPLFVVYEGSWYFPLFSNLLSPQHFPSMLERCWNLGAILFPIGLFIWIFSKRLLLIFGLLLLASILLISNSQKVKEPSALHLVIKQLRDCRYDEELTARIGNQMEESQIRTPRRRFLAQNNPGALAQSEMDKVTCIVWPPFGVMSWYEDVGGSRDQNELAGLEFMTRKNRQDFLSALLFGLRVSLFVGAATFCLSILIAVPLGLVSGYLGGWFDLALCRFIEVWESLPQFLTLLLIITFFETKTIFLVVGLLALFGWTTLFRYVRAEVLSERKQPYVECLELYGINRMRILFRHLLPNSIYPVLALAPFEIMGAITRESALSFLGLGDEQICSLGILMDEGRLSFPQEGILLWPPALLLTLLLISIAFLGEGIRRSWNVRTGA